MSPRSKEHSWSVSLNVEIARPIPASIDAGRIAGMFGLSGGTEKLYEDFTFAISPGQIVAITGPSGGGKSMLLAAAEKEIRTCVKLDTAGLGRSSEPAIAALKGGTLGEKLNILSRCGLAEAATLVTPARHLSGGQLYRLALARGVHAAARRKSPTLVIADEFAESLDPATAEILCTQTRKLVSGSRIAMLLATARSELVGSLQPDSLVVKPLRGPASIIDGRSIRHPAARKWRIQRGTISDYDALSCFHYLAGRPATHKRVYVIRSGANRPAGVPEVAAVCVVSPPLANVRGRNAATNRRYCGPDRRSAMLLLNSEVESISRVVVHPIFRGCGLGVKLVRHAIADAQTPLVEALAAMGAVHPLFTRAKMTGYDLPPDMHMARFISAAESVGIRAEQITAVEPVRKLLAKRTKAASFLRNEINRCIQRVFSTAQLSRLADPVAELARRAGRQYVYYLISR